MANDRSASNEQLEASSFLYGGNADYIENLHARWLSDRQSVAPEWQAFFAGLDEEVSVIKQNADGPSWEKQPMANWFLRLMVIGRPRRLLSTS
jgi:2-oxoglutarate dehydrogenase E1 component